MNFDKLKQDNLRIVLFVSDRTGLTAETYGKNILAQFPDIEFETMTLAFIDSESKARQVVEHINELANASSYPPIVFSSMVEPNRQAIVNTSHAIVIDLFNTFLETLEKNLGIKSAHRQGISKHLVSHNNAYQKRIDAIDYAITHDDGVRPEQYNDADVILVGVSRSGKTPTCLYLAMNFSLKACNYPLTDDDLIKDELPSYLKPYQHKLIGLTIKPVPLARIRKKRKPDTQYASLQQCQQEVTHVLKMFNRYNLPVFDTTETSIEEIATYVVKTLGVSQQRIGFA
jgi:regulator of PEP synthase PpsR (kinase-PPPase family)